LPESSYESTDPNTTYTLKTGTNNGLSVYLTNRDPLKAGDSISFKFKGNFEYGKTYMVCADDPLYYSAWPTPADTEEIIDEAANPSNNYFVFTVPPDPATIPICFPKGTPVLTNLGPVAIEKLILTSILFVVKKLLPSLNQDLFKSTLFVLKKTL